MFDLSSDELRTKELIALHKFWVGNHILTQNEFFTTYIPSGNINSILYAKQFKQEKNKMANHNNKKAKVEQFTFETEDGVKISGSREEVAKVLEQLGLGSELHFYFSSSKGKRILISSMATEHITNALLKKAHNELTHIGNNDDFSVIYAELEDIRTLGNLWNDDEWINLLNELDERV